MYPQLKSSIEMDMNISSSGLLVWRFDELNY